MLQVYIQSPEMELAYTMSLPRSKITSRATVSYRNSCNIYDSMTSTVTRFRTIRNLSVRIQAERLRLYGKLYFTTLLADSADDKLIVFLFFPGNRCRMQISPKSFSRRQIDNSYLIFLGKQGLKFHANCLLGRQLA